MRATLMPPEVEPEQPPMIATQSTSSGATPGQSTKLAVVRPVEQF
jgi:hypothetical protein